MIGRFNRSTLAAGLSIVTALAPAAPTFAQQMGQSSQQGQGHSAAAAQPQTQVPLRTLRLSDQDYTRGKPLFPPILQPYKPTRVLEPDLTNSPRSEQMIHAGKLLLAT